MGRLQSLEAADRADQLLQLAVVGLDNVVEVLDLSMQRRLQAFAFLLQLDQGTAAPGFGTDALSVALTSDADFATGSFVTLSGGKLVYTPGLVTAAKVGPDVIKYTVTDTVTGAVTTETQTVILSNGPAPIVTLATSPAASNAQTATLGTTTPGYGTDALSVTLTSDADFATGSKLVLNNGSLVYTPGLVTAAKAGSDVIKYTVTDTITGAVTTETQTVTLSNGPGPIVTLAAAPTASNAQAAVLGTAAPGFGADALSVTLTSDASFATGSSVTLSGGKLVYTPGQVTAAKAGSDLINYVVTDTVTGATTLGRETVTLIPVTQLASGTQKVVVLPGQIYMGGGADEFVVSATTIASTIDGGSSGKNSLTVTGGGTIVMGANITDIAAVRLTGGSAAPTNFTANNLLGLVIFTSAGSDTIHDGTGGDTVNINSATATVFGGGGKDTFYVTAASIGATIDGGAGASSLGVNGGGTETMGANITHVASVQLIGGTPGAAGFNFTANATPGLIIVGSAGNDTIHIGDASQTIRTLGQNTLVLATAATAGATVQEIGAGNITTLEIAGGGTTTLNGNDGQGLLVVLDAATHLNLGTAAFITAAATTSGSTLVAQQTQQTLSSLVGGTTMVGYSGGSDTFLGTKAGLTGDTIMGLTDSDKIHVTDLLPSAGVIFAQTAAGQGTLSLEGGPSLTLTGTFNPSHFHIATDGHAGSFISYL